MRAIFTLLIFFCITFGLNAQINSVQPGDWDNTATWDCGCVPDVNSFDDIFVNHNITITNDINLNRVTITNGNTVTINSAVTVYIEEDFFSTPLVIEPSGILVNNGTLDLASFLFVTPCQIDGTLESSSTITLFDPSVILFNSGSTYRHNFASGGDIPLATWDANSTVEITGLTNTNPVAPNNLNQTFGNFTWNTPSMGSTSSFSLGGQLTDVQGNLRFVSTGSPVRVVRFANSGSGFNLNIGGDFIIEGGTIILTQTNLSTATTVSLGGVSGGNFSQSGGNLIFSSSNSSDVNLDVRGNFTKSAGGLTSGATSGKRIRFIGSGSDQTYSVVSVASAFDFVVQTGASLVLSSPLITSGSSGTFTLNGTVKLNSTSTSGAVQGDIPMATRTFNSGSTIQYNNGSTKQWMGSAHPTSSGVNAIINNPNHVEIVSGVNPTIGGNLTLSSGNLIVPSSRTLAMNGTFSAGSNSINVASSSNLVIGNSASPFGTLVTSGSSIINDLTISRPGQPFIIGNDLRIDGTFTHDASSVNFDNRTLTIGNNYTPTSGSLVGNSSSTLIITGLGTVGVIPLSGTLGTLTIDQPSGVVNTTSVTISNALNVLTGTYSGAGSVTLSNGTTVTRRDGTITKSLTASGVYNLIYTNTAAIDTGNEIITSPSTALNNLTVNGANTVTLNAGLTNVQINGMLALTTGIFNSNSKTLDFKGNIVSNATGTFTGSSITFSGNSTLSGAVALVLPDITIATAGILNLGTGTVDFTGNIDHDNGGGSSLVAGTGTVRFSGTSTITCDVNNVPRFNNLQILTGGSMAIDCVSASCGTAPNQFGIEVAGDWNSNNSGSTFTPNQSRVILNGVTQSISTLSSHSFFGLQLLGTGTTTLSNSLRVTNNLILGQTATMDTGSSHPVNIGGDFLVNGTFVPNQGTVTFNGTGNQRIDRTIGSGAANKDFYNITINKSGGTFNVQSTVASTSFRVSNEFRISQNGGAATDVDFDGPSNTGMLILRSTSTATARIPSVPSGTMVIGNLTVERYIQNDDASRAWRYFAPPLVGTTVADWQGEIQITGQFSNPSTGPGIPNPNVVSLYRWIETNGGLASNRWSAWPNNISNPASSFALNNGEGYSIFVRNQGTPTTDLRGSLRLGDVAIGLTRTGTEVDAAGFNLVGNPYPAPVNWDLVSIPGGVSSTISMLDNVNNANLGAGQFVYYVQSGPDIGNFTGTIASSQAFWVNLTTGSSATLTLTESNKASDINPVVVRERTIANILRVKLFGIGSNDETVVYFNEGATSHEDLSFDARKLLNQNINLYSFLESNPETKYAINGINSAACSQLIKLGINDLDVDFLPTDPDISTNLAHGEDITPLGEYTFEFSEMESFDTDYSIYLIDKFSGMSIDVLKQSNYSFQVTEDVNSKGENRFELLISKAQVENDKLITVEDICNGSSAKIEIFDAEVGVTYYAALGGNTISDLTIGSGSNLILNVAENKLSLGENNLIVYGMRGGCDAVPMLQEVSITKEPLLEVSSISNAIRCKEGAVTLSASGALSGNYRWYEGTDSSPIAGATDAQFVTPVLQKSKTYYVSIVNALDCEGPKKLVKAEVINYDDIAVQIEGNTLISSYSEGNQWYLDGNIIAGATAQTYTPLESGYYEVQVSFGACATSAGRSFVVTDTEDPLIPDGIIVYYPNPVTDVLSVELNDPDLSNPRIVDVMGREIGQIQMSGAKDKRIGSFDFTNKAQGIYILQVTTKSGTLFNKRITKK